MRNALLPRLRCCCTLVSPAFRRSYTKASASSSIVASSRQAFYLRKSILSPIGAPLLIPSFFQQRYESSASGQSASPIIATSKSSVAEVEEALVVENPPPDPTATMNGSPRAKRKAPPSISSHDGRPPKHHRGLNNGKESPGDNTPDEADEYMDDVGEESLSGQLQPHFSNTTAADTAEWQETIQRVVRNVVSIRFCMTCSFDTDPALTSEATGFVVDADRGYVAQTCRSTRRCWGGLFFGDES